MRKFQSSLVILLVLFLSSCNQTVGTYEENNELITEIEIIKYESYPQQVNVVVRGQLTDSCTKLDDIIETQSGNTLMLTITTSRETNKICSPVNQAFVEVIPLNVVGLRAGIYNVKVNNLTGVFELDVDNFVQ